MLSKEDLEKMYWGQEMSLSEIAKEIGVVHATVIYWMKKYGIESRTLSESLSIRSRKPSKEELHNMYWDQGMSQSEIAKYINVYQQTVGNWIKECGIEIRTISEALVNGDFTGERSGNWQGGISFEPYCNKFNGKFKEAVRERDDYTCQLCGCEQSISGKKLSVHHIHYDKGNCYPDVVALCNSCHGKVNSNRNYWEQYFENQLLERGMLNWRIN